MENPLNFNPLLCCACSVCGRRIPEGIGIKRVCEPIVVYCEGCYYWLTQPEMEKSMEEACNVKENKQN